MSQAGGPVEILRRLDKSNCLACGMPTCMAFAVAVSHGRKRLADCPKLDVGAAAPSPPPVARQIPWEEELLGSMEPLRRRLASIDLAAAAPRLGGTFAAGTLTIPCLGKAFGVGADGAIRTDIHVHGWIAIPVFDYIVRNAGIPPAGRWVSFRDLRDGTARYPLFAQRGEKPCQRLADEDADLFETLLDLFGKPEEDRDTATFSHLLHPLPNVPMRIRYWKPEEGMGSDLRLLFDATATDNLGIESIHLLGTGLVTMLEKIAVRHGLAPAPR
jgi:hypothetical protein